MSLWKFLTYRYVVKDGRLEARYFFGLFLEESISLHGVEPSRRPGLFGSVTVRQKGSGDQTVCRGLLFTKNLEKEIEQERDRIEGKGKNRDIPEEYQKNNSCRELKDYDSIVEHRLPSDHPVNKIDPYKILSSIPKSPADLGDFYGFRIGYDFTSEKISDEEIFFSYDDVNDTMMNIHEALMFLTGVKDRFYVLDKCDVNGAGKHHEILLKKSFNNNDFKGFGSRIFEFKSIFPNSEALANPSLLSPLSGNIRLLDQELRGGVIIKPNHNKNLSHGENFLLYPNNKWFFAIKPSVDFIKYVKDKFSEEELSELFSRNLKKRNKVRSRIAHNMLKEVMDAGTYNNKSQLKDRMRLNRDTLGWKGWFKEVSQYEIVKERYP